MSKEGGIKFIRSNSIFFEVKRRFSKTNPGCPGIYFFIVQFLFVFVCLEHKNEIQKRQKKIYEDESWSILNKVPNYRNEKSRLFTWTYFLDRKSFRILSFVDNPLHLSSQ